MTLRVGAYFLLAGLLWSVPAAAMEPSAEARRLYAEGKAEYAQGHYEDAVKLFERSYALFASPALLFNMAQARRLAGPEHCGDALALYKSYLAALPDAENRREVEERIAELGECPPHDEPASVAPKPEPALAPREPSPSRSPVRAIAVPTSQPAKMSRSLTGPVLVAGTGAALLVAGGVLYARAWDKHREAEDVCPCYPGTYRTWEVLTNVSFALMAAGSAAVVGGVAWWAIGEPSSSRGPARAMLGFSGKF